MNVSGHRLSTAELESALVKHKAVAEAAVIGKPHELTGQAVVAFVTLKAGEKTDDNMASNLRDWVAAEIGKFARPEQIRFTEGLAEDPQRQNHAPSASGDRHDRQSLRRHHHARRSQRHQPSRQPTGRGVGCGEAPPRRTARSRESGTCTARALISGEIATPLIKWTFEVCESILDWHGAHQARRRAGAYGRRDRYRLPPIHPRLGGLRSHHDRVHEFERAPRRPQT